MTESTVGHTAPRGEALYRIGVRAAEMKNPQADFLKLAIGEFLLPKTTELSSVTHAARTRSVVEYYGFTDEAVSYQLSLMPLVAELTSSDPAARAEAQALTQDLYDAIEDESRVPFLEGLGFAVSKANLANEIRQTLRNQARTSVDVIYSKAPREIEVDQTETNGTMKVHGAVVSRNYQQRVKDQALLHAVIDGTVPDDTDPQHLKDLLVGTPLLDLDINILKDSMDEHDVQGLVARGAEAIATLRRSRMTSEQTGEIWLLCNNVLAYDAPFLDVCGQSAMAAELQGLAYEFFYGNDPDVIQKAIWQRELSEEYHPVVVDMIDSALDTTIALNPDTEYATQGVTLESRVKSVGSLEKKFSSSKYQDQDLVSDGIAIRLLVPDETFEHDPENFVVNFIQNLDLKVREADNTLIPWHPTGDAYTDYRDKPKPNGYRSLHLCYAIEIDGEVVPFEIHVVGEMEHEKQTYGPSNHLSYKRTEKDPVDGDIVVQNSFSEIELQHMALFKARAETTIKSNETTYYSGLNPHTWIKLIKVLPDLKTRLTEVFGLSSSDDLVPNEIQGVTIDRPDRMSQEKTFLPPSHLDREQFLFLLKLLDSKLAQSPSISRALDLVYATQNGPRQNEYTVAEGHLLPTALHTAIMMTISNRRWENNPDMNIPIDSSLMEIVVVTALLHDTVEDVYRGRRAEGLEYVESNFGHNEALLLDRLTLPEGEFTNKLEKQISYLLEMLKEPSAVGELSLEIKDSDRMSNHMSDIISVLRGDAIDTNRAEFILEYISKTERTLKYALSTLPESYKTMHQTVFLLLDKVKLALAA